MSGYWDALDRAALGLPGTAVPRPHALFEPDSLVDSPALEMIEDEVEWRAPRDLVAPVDPAAPAAHEPRHTPQVDEHPAVEATPVASHALREQPRELQVQAAPVIEPAADPVSSPAPPTGSRTERIETHRLETIQRVDRVSVPAVVPNASQAEPAIAAPRDLEARIETVAAAPREAPVASRQDEAEPIAVVAQPRVETPAAPPAAVDRPPSPLVIEIERIEIRIEQERPAPVVASRPRAAGAVPSLEDYLARRSQATS